MKRYAVALAVALVVGGAAPAIAGPAPSDHAFSVSTVTLPTTAAQARKFGRDQNGDGRVDDKLGSNLALLASNGLDLNGTLTGLLSSYPITGTIRSVSLRHARAATLTVDAGGTSSVFNGHIAHHKATFGPGTLTLPIDGHALTLVNTKLKATCGETGCSKGKVSGAIPSAAIDQVLVPAVADLLTTMLAACKPSCTGGDGLIEQYVDTDHDYTISTTELTSNPMFAEALKPDLDLFKANGKRGHDGKRDSLSFGVGFDAPTAIG